jgi:glycine betaine/choline ABC-type transport system substrate-binding protein
VTATFPETMRMLNGEVILEDGTPERVARSFLQTNDVI